MGDHDIGASKDDRYSQPHQPYVNKLTTNAGAFEISLPEPAPEPIETTFATNKVALSNEPQTSNKRRTTIQNLLAQLGSPEMSRHPVEVPQPSVSPLHTPQPASPSTPPTPPDLGDNIKNEHSANNTPIMREQSLPLDHTMDIGNHSAAYSQPKDTAPWNEHLRGTESKLDGMSLRQRTTPHEPHDADGAVPLSSLEEVPKGFAMLTFDDGRYVINTYAVLLGRDTRAYAQAKEYVARDQLGLLDQQTREKVQGSVISEKAGIFNVDDDPAEEQDPQEAELLQNPHASESDVVDPRDIHIRRPLPPFDYNGAAEEQAEWDRGDDETPAPVTTAHLPDPYITQTIPLHAVTSDVYQVIRTQKSISREHLKIFWDIDDQGWKLEVLGANGCFLNFPDGKTITDPVTGQQHTVFEEFVPPQGPPLDLEDGQKFQVQAISIKFSLPRSGTPVNDSGDESDQDVSEEAASPHASQRDSSEDATISKPTAGKGKSKANVDLARPQQAPQPISVPLLGPDGKPLPPKKRGPGRPPKDGISSTRQKREEARRLKEAQARAENGGVTPPPSSARSKPNKPQAKPMEIVNLLTEKRKYTKRKRSSEDIMQSVEGGDNEDVENDGDGNGADAAVVKRSKKSRTPSPDYPPLDSLTAEQLAEPQDSYMPMLWKLMMKKPGHKFTLRQIYQEVQLAYPCFRKRETGGWTSSVRHNLNAGWKPDKDQAPAFVRGEKDGKGHLWSAHPEYKEEKASEKRRQPNSQSQLNRPRPTAPPARSQVSQGPPQWQANQNNMQPPNGQMPYMWPNGHIAQPPPMAPTGMQWYPNGPMQPPPPYKIPGPPNMLSNNPPPNGDTFRPPSQPGQNGIENPPAAGIPPQNGYPQPPFPQHAPPSQGAPQHQSPVIPRPEAAQTNPGQPGSQPSPQTQPGTAFSGSPTTVEGLSIIMRFQTILLKDTHQIDYVKWIFQTAMQQELHGREAPPFQGTPDEPFMNQVLRNIREIIEKHPNSNFTGFKTRAPAVKDEPERLTLKEVSVRKQVDEGTETGEQDGDQTPEEEMENGENVEEATDVRDRSQTVQPQAE